jgi:HAD superfamily hydrolase (TIGR01509 family)
MIKGIIFDMDGVMIDTERQSTLGWLHAFEAHGGNIPMWLVNKFKGAPAQLSAHYFDEYFKGEYDYWQMRQERTDYIHEMRKTTGVPVKYGLYTLLEAIRQRRLKCAVATSTQRQSAMNSLMEIGAMSYLDTVVYGDEVENGKPAPDIFLRAATSIGVETSECIVIEDSINGIKAGHAAGMKVVHVPDTIDITEDIAALTDCICHNLAQVVTVLDYWNGGEIRIDRQRVKDTFARYTSAYNADDPKIKLKIEHTYRVADLCQCIAENLGLSDKDIDIAWLSGMLHDIGRFEQIRRYGTFSDAKSVSHGELGANILFKDGLIANFVPELANLKGLDLWNILDHALRLHSVYRIPEEMDERERMFTEILRDADKIDILRVNFEVGVEEIYGATHDEVVNGVVSDEVMADFAKEHAVLREYKKTPLDHVAGHISLAFELVYPVSFELAISQGYLERLLNYPVESEKAKAQFEEMRGIMEKFVKKQEFNAF